MPGIHPASRRQVQWAFAAEARGQFGPKPGTPWTSPEAKQKRSLARDWAHRWKCWSWDEKVRGKLPKDCKAAIKLLEQIRTEHPNWKVPDGIKRAAPKPKVVRLVTPVQSPPMPIAARGAKKGRAMTPAQKQSLEKRRGYPTLGTLPATAAELERIAGPEGEPNLRAPRRPRRPPKIKPERTAEEVAWMSLSAAKRHRALAAAYPGRDTSGWSVTLPLDKRAFAQARKLYGGPVRAKRHSPAEKPKTAKPKKARTKTRAQHKRRRSDVITADELIAAALGQF